TCGTLDDVINAAQLPKATTLLVRHRASCSPLPKRTRTSEKYKEKRVHTRFSLIGIERGNRPSGLPEKVEES
ncbi:hypothetical protein N9059_00335, partial [bacterium]|nr:hypothetical protein [bacterium]